MEMDEQKQMLKTKMNFAAFLKLAFGKKFILLDLLTFYLLLYFNVNIFFAK